MSGGGAGDVQLDRQVQVRRLVSGDATLLRDVRLRALGDAPYAFASWLARETAYASEFWEDRVTESDAARAGAIFVGLDRWRIRRHGRRVLRR